MLSDFGLPAIDAVTKDRSLFVTRANPFRAALLMGRARRRIPLPTAYRPRRQTGKRSRHRAFPWRAPRRHAREAPPGRRVLRRPSPPAFSWPRGCLSGMRGKGDAALARHGTTCRRARAQKSPTLFARAGLLPPFALFSGSLVGSGLLSGRLFGSGLGVGGLSGLLGGGLFGGGLLSSGLLSSGLLGGRRFLGGGLLGGGLGGGGSLGGCRARLPWSSRSGPAAACRGSSQKQGLFFMVIPPNVRLIVSFWT